MEICNIGDCYYKDYIKALCSKIPNINIYKKPCKIMINYEHTLVKNGGRSVPENTQFGKISYDNDKNYYVRIDKYDNLIECDIIIDYSIPNIINVLSSGLFQKFSEKHIYIAPCIYDTVYISKLREINVLTTFINTEEPRRKYLLQNLKNTGVNHINIHNCFDKNELQKIYRNTKIIINIHQTNEHDTFEELRVLPALQCGVLVISEKSPLSDSIPYNNLIIWSSYDDILLTLQNVIQNYDIYHNEIFSSNNISIFDKLQKENFDILEKKIIQYHTCDTL
jgi:hypothetical protein